MTCYLLMRCEGAFFLGLLGDTEILIALIWFDRFNRESYVYAETRIIRKYQLQQQWAWFVRTIRFKSFRHSCVRAKSRAQVKPRPEKRISLSTVCIVHLSKTTIIIVPPF
jgi:hypothetical protein